MADPTTLTKNPGLQPGIVLQTWHGNELKWRNMCENHGRPMGACIIRCLHSSKVCSKASPLPQQAHAKCFQQDAEYVGAILRGELAQIMVIWNTMSVVCEGQFWTSCYTSQALCTLAIVAYVQHITPLYTLCAEPCPTSRQVLECHFMLFNLLNCTDILLHPVSSVDTLQLADVCRQNSESLLTQPVLSSPLSHSVSGKTVETQQYSTTMHPLARERCCLP